MHNKPNVILDIAKYEIKASDCFFFDNNIWMYIYYPLANYQKKKQSVYSKFFQYVLSRRNHIYINSLVISEFSNRYLKLDYNRCNETGKPRNFSSYKKDYVGSDQFKTTASEIKSYLNNILRVCQKSSDEFNNIDTKNVFELFEKIGFNDSYYIHLATMKNWIIVTDDSDFTKSHTPQLGVKILTFV